MSTDLRPESRTPMVRALEKSWASFRILLSTAVLTLAISGPATHPAGTTSNPSVLLTVEGTVEIAAYQSQEWVPGRTNQLLQPGQSLRTGRRSRATVRLGDLSVLRAGERTRLDFLPDKDSDGKTVLNVKAGAAYLLNRARPTETRFVTPVVMGAIRGTEFNIEVAEDGSTVVTLLEGAVTLSNEQGTVDLASGERGTVSPGEAPAKTAVLNAINVIQWSLYYPGVLDTQELNLSADERTALQASLDSYRVGDLKAALAAWPEGRAANSDAERLFRAALLLSVGEVPEALTFLGALDNRAPLADALHRLIAAVKNQKIDDSPAPATASQWLGESYYLQAQHQFAEALEAARAAVKQSPQFGFAWVRVAELEFGGGNTAKAEQALDTALKLAPRNAQALALKAFMLAARDHIPEAIAAFDQAIAMDGALANAWLGRGLCRFRQGQGEEGRRDLQTAAALEPNRSGLRSYLGKAWFERHDTERAEKELQLAKKLDPQDPTPWLYSALMHQADNRVNEAITELEQARDLNGNRMVYRSQLMLDQDQAVRNANLAKIYLDAGMREASVRAASQSVGFDYANYSAHLFLSDSYNALRDPNQINLRYETPWLSELLMANLLAPVGAGVLSQTVSEQEYSRLIDVKRMSVFSETEYRSQGDWRQSASLALNLDQTSLALSGGYLSLNGYRPNNDVEAYDLSLQAKQQITRQDSLYFQVQRYDYHSGDVRQYYDQSLASRTLRVTEIQDPNLFLGYHREWRPGMHTLFLAGRLQDELTQQDPAAIGLITTKRNTGEIYMVNQRPIALDWESELEAYSAELQQIIQTPKHTLLVGGRYQAGDLDTRSTLVSNGTTLAQDLGNSLARANGYAYYTLRPIEPLRLTAGLSYDHLEYPVNSEIPPLTHGEQRNSQWSPKAGIEWNPWKQTTLRGAFTRSLGGIFYDTSVRLEPTQVAGFTQGLRSVLPESVAGLMPGTEFQTWGLGWDQQLPTRTYLTVYAELLESVGERTVGTLDAFGPTVMNVPAGVKQSLDYQEKTLAVAVNQLVGEAFALGATYRLSKGSLEDRIPALPLSQSDNFSMTANRDVSAVLQQANLYALVNHPSGFFSRFDALWSAQSNSGYTSRLPADDFWQLNCFVGYRFARRRAEIRAGVLNLADQDYQLNPLNFYVELPHDRMAVINLKLNF